MSRKNALTSATPLPVESALVRLGRNLRTARLARNLTIDDVAAKIGTGRRAVMEAEKGKPGTGVAVYATLLWAYNLLPQFEQVADPSRDEEGIARAHVRTRARASSKGALDNDF